MKYRKPRRIDLDRKNITLTYLSGLTIKKIAEINNCSCTCIRGILKKNNIKIRYPTKFKKGHKPWNKWLTKDIDERIAKYGILSGTSRKGIKKSEKTKKNMSGKTGIKSNNWKGGLTLLNKNIRAMVKYNEWKNNIFKRDNYICQKCKKRGGYLISHHIKPLSKIIQNNNIKTIDDAKLCIELWDINNGITYCKKCHIIIDNYIGKRGKNVKKIRRS